MRIDNFIFIVLSFLSCSTIWAQESLNDSIVIANEDSCNVESIQSTIDACLLLAYAVERKNNGALLMAAQQMNECKISYFKKLREQDGDFKSFNGHLIFDVDYALQILNMFHDEYIRVYADRRENPYDYVKNRADYINKKIMRRSQMQDGQIFTKTCFVKAHDKAIYSFESYDRQELAVVAEPGGFITIRVHVVNEQTRTNEWHNDTKDVTNGRNSRKAAFTLPHSPRSIITLEITNCTNKDISVVVISN